MIQQAELCKQCGLCGEEKLPNALVREPSKLRIAVVCDAPRPKERLDKSIMTGSRRKITLGTLQALGLDTDEIFFTNACQCCTPVNREPSENEIHCCKYRLVRDLAEFNPDRVLAMGIQSINALGMSGLPVSQLRGRPYNAVLEGLDDSKLQTWIIPTLHPDIIAIQPNMYPEFSRDLQKLLIDLPMKIIDPSVRTINTTNDFMWAIEDLSRVNYPMALDLETTGFNPLKDYIISVAIAPDEKVSYIFTERLMRNDNCYNRFKEFIESRKWITHNGIGFDSQFMEYCWEIKLETEFDTMLSHYTIDERKGTHGLDVLAGEYFGLPSWKQEVKSLASGKKGTYANVPEDILYKYQATDTCVTFALKPVLIKQMKDEGTTNLLLNHIQPVAKDLSEIQMYGALIDQEHLKKLGQQWNQEVVELIARVRHEVADDTFNVKSPKQVSALIYDDYGFKPPAGMKKDTRKETLEALNEIYDNEVLHYIVEARHKSHLVSTYVDGLLERLDDDGRIRTDFLMHGTETGRLSSQNPNLQNIPQLIGPMIRDAFIAPPGYGLVECDYSQLELRIAAFYSNDSTLKQAFLSGLDIHRFVASQVFNKPFEDVTHEERHIAKTINFGILYGRQAKSLAASMGCSIWEAQQYLNSYFERYPGLKQFMNDCKKHAFDDQFVCTPMGRKRRFALITDRNANDIERQAYNMPVQSLAADVCLDSIHRIHNEHRPNTHIILTVHDSILVECPEAEMIEVAHWMQDIMSDVRIIHADFPIIADAKIGKRWGSLEKLAA